VKSNKPLVSVYIPTHNRSTLLIQAIESVLAQTYSNIEIIVCSDGSTDNTDQVMQDYCQKYSNIKYLKNIIAKGACFSRNRCIEEAEGEYITGLDDDDLFHPNRIEIFVKLYNNDDAFLCSSIILKPLSKFKGFSLFKTKTNQLKCIKITLDDILFENIVGNQIFIPIKKLKSVNGFSEDMPAWQDYDTWVKLMVKYGNARKIEYDLYVADDEPQRARITNSNRRIDGCLKFYEKYDHLLNEKNKRNAHLRKAIFSNTKLPFIELVKYFNIEGGRNWLRAVVIKLGHKF